MDPLKKLEEITSVLVNKELDYEVLTQTIDDYKELLLGLSGLDMKDRTNREHKQLDTGRAIGTTWAAMCVDDMMRTKRFVAGLSDAVNHVLKQKEKPIHILYAGTGPYAALMLPILATHSKEEVQVTLLEVNEESFDCMKRVVDQLGFEHHVAAYELADATRYKIKEPVDIVLSETMLRSLATEQQVPIVMHLMEQVSEDTLLIPEEIEVSLVLIRPGGFREKPKYHKLGTLFELSKKQLKTTRPARKGSTLVFPERTIPVPKSLMPKYAELSMLTEIKVFGEEHLTINDSGLTLPQRIRDLAHIEDRDYVLHSHYKIDADPGIVVELN